MTAGIALGSNIEPRLLHLQTARRSLLELHHSPAPVPCSRVYETAPVDCAPGTAPFLNAVLEIVTDLTPHDLLTRLHEIEQTSGRPPGHGKNTSRTLDLDLLYCDDLSLHDEILTLPHPRVTTRQFVLQPLSDIRPHMVLPGQQRSVAELAKDGQPPESISVYSLSIY